MRRIWGREPDLVAYRPLVESVTSSLAGSATLGPVLRRATRQLHAALIHPGSEPIVLRLRRAANLVPAGPEEPYLCHALCEIGATPLDGVLTGLQSCDAHSREVVTVFIQDEVTPANTAAAFQRAGLLPYVHVQAENRPWPTLGQMVRSGRRLVVLMENHGGGSAYPCSCRVSTGSRTRLTPTRR